MDLSFFVRGLVIGFSIAAVVGPIGLLCIQRTLHRGLLYGLLTGLGAATADGMYGSIAGFGLTAIAGLLISLQGWIRLIGGLFLIYLGIKTMFSRPAEQAAKAQANSFLSAYGSTLLLTLTNPQTILSFAAIFAGLGLAASKNTAISALFTVGGVFLGSTLWWCLLSGSLSFLRKRFTQRWLVWVNRVAGSVITLFGIFALLGFR